MSYDGKANKDGLENANSISAIENAAAAVGQKLAASGSVWKMKWQNGHYWGC